LARYLNNYYKLDQYVILAKTPPPSGTRPPEPEKAMAPRLDDEAPLLGKPGAASPPSPPAKRTNKYPFFCAVLASMTSVLAGYSTHAHAFSAYIYV
jgi:hypothetical protein